LSSLTQIRRHVEELRPSLRPHPERATTRPCDAQAATRDALRRVYDPRSLVQTHCVTPREIGSGCAAWTTSSWKRQSLFFFPSAPRQMSPLSAPRCRRASIGRSGCVGPKQLQGPEGKLVSERGRRRRLGEIVGGWRLPAEPENVEPAAAAGVPGSPDTICGGADWASSRWYGRQDA
jgi:hypothetical protein